MIKTNLLVFSLATVILTMLTLPLPLAGQSQVAVVTETMANNQTANSSIQKCFDIIREAHSKKTDAKGTDHTISLEVCIYKALLENHKIKASFNKVAARRNLVQKTKSLRFGKLSFNIFASKYNDSIAEFTGKDQSAARNITLDIPIYTGGAIKSAENKAKLASQIARFESQQTIQEIASQTIEAYLSLLQSQWLISVATEYLRQTDLQLKLIEDRVKAGVAVKSDRLTVVVARNQAKLLLISAGNFRKRAISALNLVMAGRLNRELTATPPENLEVHEESLERGIARAKIKRPELLTARLGLKVFREELVTARSKLKPTIGLNMVYGDLSPIFSGETDSAQVTIAGTFPLYEGGGLRADIHNAQNTIKEQKELLRFYEEASDFEVTQAHIDMSEASERMAIAIENISSSKENARIVEEKYKSGTAIVLEMVEANIELLNARMEVLKTLIAFFISSSNYYKTSGDISRFFNEELRERLEKRSPKFGIKN